MLGLTILFVFLYSSSAPKSALADNSCTASQVMCSGVCTTPFCTTDAQCVSSYGAGAVCETFAGGCANTCTYGAGGGTGTAPVVSPSTNTGADGTGSTVATPALPQGCNPSTGIYSTSTGLLCYPIGCTSFSGYSTSTGLSCFVVATSGSSGSGAGTVTHSPTGMGLFSIVDPFNGGAFRRFKLTTHTLFILRLTTLPEQQLIFTHGDRLAHGRMVCKLAIPGCREIPLIFLAHQIQPGPIILLYK